MSAVKTVSSNSLRALPDGRLSFACPHCSATLALAKKEAMEGPCPHCGGLIGIEPPKEKKIPPPPRGKIRPAPLGRPPTPPPGELSDLGFSGPPIPKSVSDESSLQRKRRRKYQFGFLLVSPFIIAGIAYLAIMGANPFRQWVDERVAERNKAISENADGKGEMSEAIRPGPAAALPAERALESDGGSSIQAVNVPLADFAATPTPEAREFRGMLARLPEAADGSIPFSFREESGTTEIAFSLPAGLRQTKVLGKLEPGQPRQATLRLRWTEGENPYIVLDEWIGWGYQGSNDETK